MMQELTDDSFDDDSDRPLERWAPLGAANSSPPSSHAEMSELTTAENLERLEQLEMEQEQLNSSLLALTTHFAQVQFRLKQIVSAEPSVKEDLLKELEEFAFRGIPDMRACSMLEEPPSNEELSEAEHDIKIAQQRTKQLELIGQLKSQLEDLETYAYETGSADIPTSKVIEKQKAVIDQLNKKLNVEDFEHFDKLSSDELRQAVDKAIGQIVHPAKVKEKLVDQLKTQIVDLERFIEFLQATGEGAAPGDGNGNCTCHHHGNDHANASSHPGSAGKKTAMTADDKNFRTQALSIMRHALTLLQIFAISQFGCGGREFQKNLLKRTTKGNHWGDLRARLEVAIDRVMELAQRCEVQSVDAESADDGNARTAPISPVSKTPPTSPVQKAPLDDDILTSPSEQELITAVRKELAIALRDLLQHGLMEVGQSQSLVPFGCLPTRSWRESTKMMHAWDLFLKYYEAKHGKDFSDTPARKLSQSFGLEIVGGKAITAKQTLLTAIEEIRSTHLPLKRNEDSQFKAFVCLGLNQKKLVTWLRILLRNTSLVEYYYQPWSYVVKTGFDDALASLDKLMNLNFHLPTDLAIRPFHNIRDAF